MTKSYSSRFVDIIVTIGAVMTLQWFLRPLIEYNILVQRNKDGSIGSDLYYIDGRSDGDSFSTIENLNDLLDISVVVPAFNEESRLPIMLDDALLFMRSWCNEQRLSYEVLIVDDASTDRTTEVAIEYSKNNANTIRILKLGENHGKGGAVKLGVGKARGKYILMADADGATDIRDLSELYRKILLIQENVEGIDGDTIGMALGSRAHLQENSIATRAFYRTVLMRGFHVLVTLLCTSKIKDTQCGFKLFTRKAAKTLFGSLHLERWAFDIEIIYLAEMLVIPMTEVAVRWREVDGSKLIQTKFDVVRTSLTMARDMLCVKVAYTLGWWQVMNG